MELLKRWTLFFTASAIVAALLGGKPAAAQGTNSRIVPSDAYLLAFVPYYAGDYRTALRAFRDSARTGVRSAEGLWVDSICYYTMLGECYYQAGDLQHALENYNFALQLFLSHRNWLIRVTFPDSVEPTATAPRAQITWGASLRTPTYAHIPDRMVSLQGRLDNENVLAQGGVIRPPNYFPVRVAEVVRCTAVSMIRRREILGPACQYHPLSGQLVEALAGRPGPPNHWSAAWISLQLGLAYASAGRLPEAAGELGKAVQIADRFDHPLTCIALLELGKLHFDQGKYEPAIAFLLEATYSAAVFDRYDVMEEAFRYAAVAHMTVNKGAAFTPLKNAVEWARTKGSASLHASLCLLATDNLTALGLTKPAADYLTQSERSIRRSEMAAGRIGARYQYQQALVHYQSGAAAAGDQAFAAALTNQRNSSTSLFQVQITDTFFRDGTISPREANLLFTEVLRDPSPADWAIDPLDAFAVMLTPHPLPLEHWFELAVSRKEHDLAINITEHIRRRRFFGSLPFGGRLLALRWLLEAPLEVLNETARLQRNDLLVRFPAYAELKKQASAVADQLAAIPTTPADEEVQRQQTVLLNQLAVLSAAQEGLLRDLALRREPAEFVFPALRDLAEIRAAMPPNQATLGFFAASRYVYAYWITHDTFHHWQIPNAAAVTTRLGDLLRSLGHYDKNQAVDLELLGNQQWKAKSASLLAALLGTEPPDDWDVIDELVIIPDGVIWYVPFNSLHLKQSDELHPLYQLVRIRCAPLLALSQPDGRGVKPKPQTGVVVGRLYPHEKPEMGDSGWTALQAVLPDARRLPDRVPATSQVYSSLFDRLIVLDEIDDLATGPYEWSVMQVDQGKAGSRLNDWLALPWRGPEQLVLPGMQTAAASSLRRGGTGDEMFLVACGLMATGARTILLSQWRVGGASTHELAREFVQELPFTPASDAWQRAIELSQDRPLIPDLEPRLKAAGATEPILADHPFFWAGYLLIDSGLDPRVKER